MLLGTLVANILGYALSGNRVIRIDEGAVRARQNFQCCLIF